MAELVPDYVFVAVVAPVFNVEVFSPVNTQVSFNHILTILITDGMSDIFLVVKLGDKVIVLFMDVVAHVYWGKPFSKCPNVSMLILFISHSLNEAIDANKDSFSWFN